MEPNSIMSGGTDVIDVYETNGNFVRCFGERTVKMAKAITAADGGRVMVLDGAGSYVHTFSEQGDHLSKFQLEGRYYYLKIAFHFESKHVVVAAERKVLIYTVDGDLLRGIEHNAEAIQGITLFESFVATACSDYKVLIVLLTV